MMEVFDAISTSMFSKELDYLMPDFKFQNISMSAHTFVFSSNSTMKPIYIYERLPKNNLLTTISGGSGVGRTCLARRYKPWDVLSMFSWAASLNPQTFLADFKNFVSEEN